MMVAAARLGGETLVIENGIADERDEAPPVLVAANGENDPHVVSQGRVAALRRKAGMAIASAGRDPARHRILQNRLREEAEAGLLEADVDVLPFAGAETMHQGRLYRDGGVARGHRVGVVQRRPVGTVVVAIAGDGAQPARRLDVGPEGDVVPGRAVLPEGGDGDHDDLRVGFSHRRKVQVQVRQDPRAVVLQHDVDLFHQAQEEIAALGFGKVQGGAVLVPVHLVEIARAVVVVAQRLHPGVVAATGDGTVGRLDLDDLRAEIGQIPAGQRSHPMARKLQDADAGQRQRRGRRGRRL